MSGVLANNLKSGVPAFLMANIPMHNNPEAAIKLALAEKHILSSFYSMILGMIYYCVA